VGTLAGTTVTVGDTTVTVNSSAYGSTEAETTFNVEVVDDGDNPVGSLSGGKWVVPAGSGPVGAKLMKTGQTTSYAIGDDGDLQAGRDVDFFTLASNNPFGNTSRFTGVSGGYSLNPTTAGTPDYRDVSGASTTKAGAFPDDIAIDWSTYDGNTVLGIHWVKGGPSDWQTAINTCNSLSIGAFTTGWKLPNTHELLNFVYYSGNRCFDYAPLFSTSNSRLWTSTRNVNYLSTYAFIILEQFNLQLWGVTTIVWEHFPVRNFTVTGTTLT
jgi:hypothetical protein